MSLSDIYEAIGLVKTKCVERFKSRLSPNKRLMLRARQQVDPGRVSRGAVLGVGYF